MTCGASLPGPFLSIMITVHYIFMTFSDRNVNRLRYLNILLCCFLPNLRDFIIAVTLLLDQPSYLINGENVALNICGLRLSELF